jgi:hypothetical protein
MRSAAHRSAHTTPRSCGTAPMRNEIITHDELLIRIELGQEQS